MRKPISAVAAASIAALTACGGGNDAGDNVQAAGDQQEVLESDAANFEQAADNTVGAATETLENQAAALEAPANNGLEADANTAVAVENNAQ